MYTAGPPPAAPAPVAASRLLRVECQVFGEGGPFGWDDHIYFPDLMSSYGIECRPGLFAGRRNTFTDMSTAMLAQLAPFDDHFDVAVLTGATTDSQPGFPTCRLSHLVSRPGLAFAIFDQGLVTAFTALQVLAGVVGCDGASRALLVVLDQSNPLHERPVAQWHRVQRDCAVAILLDPAGELGRLGPPTLQVATVGEVGSVLARALDAIWAGRSSQPRVLLSGYGLARHLSGLAYGDEVHRCAPGQPATAVWASLATRLASWQDRGASVVVADYDEDLQRLGLCPVEIPAADPNADPNADPDADPKADLW